MSIASVSAIRSRRRVSAWCWLGLCILIASTAPHTAAWSNQIESFAWSDEPAMGWPVQASVVDGFRPPEFNWLAGNRGLELDTSSGDVVVAPAPGVVTFAGSVGNTQHVTIRFSPTRRVTVSFLERVDVGRGDNVIQGQRVGLAGSGLHLTVRTNSGRYLDPMLLLGRPDPSVRLVPLIR